MTAVKSILAVISDASAARASLSVALNCGRYFDAAVDALHVRSDPLAALPLAGEAMSGAMVDEMVTIATREGEARAARARALFNELTGPSGSAAHWLDQSGIEEEVVAMRAARADVTVMPRPGAGSAPAALTTLNSVLMQSGRPVLVVPPGEPTASFGQIALFWNGSTEATRAVAGALPFLARAERVTVLRVEEEEWFAPTDDLETYLGRHGVKTAIAKVLPKEGKTGRMLLGAATDAKADLMVMGAYTRSKVRQLMLGSVTGYVMKNAALPVLLCH
jgi:nucleotide-binding universal stress UspA family protein